MINILLADDHSIVRNGIKNLLERESDIRIIGEANNGAKALQLLEHATPDILLADMNMPVLGGIELAEKLMQAGSAVKVILLTMHDHHQYVGRAIKAGAAGYLFKNIGADELIFAVRHVYSGKRYLCNELSLRFLDQALAHTTHADLSDHPPAQFSEREIEVLKLIAEGYTNQEIANRIFTSKRTIEGHRRAMIASAGVQNTAALISYALRKNIIK